MEWLLRLTLLVQPISINCKSIDSADISPQHRMVHWPDIAMLEELLALALSALSEPLVRHFFNLVAMRNLIYIIYRRIQ